VRPITVFFTLTGAELEIVKRLPCVSAGVRQRSLLHAAGMARILNFSAAEMVDAQTLGLYPGGAAAAQSR